MLYFSKKIHPLEAPLSSLLWSSRHLRTWPSYGELDSQKSRAIYIYFLIVLSPRNRKRLRNKRVDCRNFSVVFLFTPLITPRPRINMERPLSLNLTLPSLHKSKRVQPFNCRYRIYWVFTQLLPHSVPAAF